MDREYLAAGLGKTAVELREQLSTMMAVSQLLERSVSPRERNYLAALNQNLYRMLRTVSRMELAHSLTSEDEIRICPAPMDLGPWTEALAHRLEDVLALTGASLRWSAPPVLLVNGDESLLSRMVPEMVNAVLDSGNQIELTVSRCGDSVHMTVAASGEAAEALCSPLDQEADEAPLGEALIRQIAQLHGGVLIPCLEGGRCKRMTVSIPCRMDLPGGRLASAPVAAASGGMDPLLVALSHRLSAEAFSPEEH